MTAITLYSTEIQRFLIRHNYHLFQPEAALIDMDGTLYDSMKNHSAAWYQMVTELGIEATRDEFYMYEGRTGASTINLLFNRAYGRDATDDEVRDLYHRKTVLFTQLPPVEPMPGASKMLRIFMEQGMKRVLVTGSGQNTLLNRLNDDFPGAFDEGMRVTSRDVRVGKPNPEPFLRAMEIAEVTPWQSVVVENAPLGVEAGDRSGAFTIGVTTGPVPREALEEAGAAIVFNSMTECADSLPYLLRSLRKVKNEL